MPVRSVIVEDEPHSLERLKTLLRGFPQIEIVGEAMDGDAAVEVINDRKPELVFLDIHLPGASGFEVLSRIAHHPGVIFVTAYDQYAIEAFEANALDYIMKPLSEERLGKAIERATQSGRGLDQTTMEILKDIARQKQYACRFAVKLQDEILLIPRSDVYFFQAEDKYVFLHTRDRKFFYDATLKKLEEMLDPNLFCRVHKSTIVALDHIGKLKKSFLGEYVIELTDRPPTRLKVSRTYQGVLKRKLRI